MQPRRIVLLRSGRHLRVAMDALAARFPGCRVAVVGTRGSEQVIELAGIATFDTFIHSGSRFRPLAFFFSRTALTIRRWRYDQVAVLWNDPDGRGQGNVNRTALALSLRGYLAITPDGTVVERALMPQLGAECLRLIASVGVAAVIGVLLYVPALAIAPLMAIVRRAGPAEAGLHVRSTGPAEAGLHVRSTGPAEAGLHVRSAGPADAGVDVESGFSRTMEND
jgi:hypothetical protein